MIAPEVVVVVKRFLGEGRDYREIARTVGINRETVGLIARGLRPDYEALRDARKRWLPGKRSRTTRRCPECHALVYMPCLACNARKERAKQPMVSAPRLRLPSIEEPLGVNLREQHRQRYDEVHTRRMLAVSTADLEKPIEMLVIDNGKYSENPPDLQAVISAMISERTIGVLSRTEEIEFCLEWCGLAMRLGRRRPRQSSTVTSFRKMECAS